MMIDTEVDELCRVAASFVGTPYHSNGMLKGVGVDCGTFLLMAYHEAGLIEAYDPGHYSEQWFLHRDEPLYLQHLLKFAAEVDEPRRGDIVMFRVGRQFAHGAIVTEWPLLIHAYKPDGLVRWQNAHEGEFADIERHPRRFFRLSRWVE